jgi:sulfite reductase alpha subunit-like flavoprotein
MKLFEPSPNGIRRPTDNARQNLNIINPPRYAQLGGLDKASRALGGNNIKITKPGGGAK